MKGKLMKIQDGCSTFAVKRLRCSLSIYINRKKWTVEITKKIDAKYFCEGIVKTACIVKPHHFTADGTLSNWRPSW